MTNHVHLLAIPEQQQSLSRTLRYVHGRFAHCSNASLNRRGHFWQNRYYSCPVEAAAVGSLLAYIELNPVRAGLAAEADHFVWSSAQVHTGFAPDRRRRARHDLVCGSELGITGMADTPPDLPWR